MSVFRNLQDRYGRVKCGSMLDIIKKYLSEGFIYAVASSPLKSTDEEALNKYALKDCSKVKIKPVLLKGKPVYQVTRTVGPKELHENLEREEAAFTGLYAALFSLAGAVLSITVMVLLKKTGKFSVTGISIAGGAAHNTGQIIVAMITLGKAVLYYFPVLIISGIAAGILTGIVTGIILKIFGGKLPDIY